jgi:hypothetical protein
MPNDISYPYRPPLLGLFAVALGVPVAIFPVSIFLIIPPSNLNAEVWVPLILCGLSGLLLIYLLFTMVVAAYFCWRHKTTVTLRRSDIILPVGLTQQETAIRYADIGYVEKVRGRAGDSLSIFRAGREIKVLGNWLPTTDIASLQAELATRRQISERNSDG